MKRIVFRMLPERGHHNATFYLGKLLQENGYEVIYATIEKMRGYIESNGFDFYSIDESEDPAIRSIGKAQHSVFKRLLQFVRQIFRLGFKWTRLIILNYNYLTDIKRKLQPDLVIVDRCYGQMVLNAIDLNIPVLQAETTVSTNYAKGIPPFTSTYLPTFSRWSNLVSDLIWSRDYIIKKLDAIVFGSFDDIVMLYAKKIGYPVSKINFKRCQNPAFETIPELIFSPREIDFPHQLHPNQHYVGPSILEDRKEEEPISFVNPFKDQGKPIIYCALGALSYRYRGIEGFFSNLIQSFKTMNDFNLIVCISNDNLRRRLMGNVSANIAFFKHVPQLSLLKEVQVMINHGGMNSITECILSEVPMLIYPGSKHLDQNGNSARVVYHGIGLRGNLRHEKTAGMVSKIKKLVTDPIFMENIREMKRRIHQQKDYRLGLQVIQSKINTTVQLTEV